MKKYIPQNRYFLRVKVSFFPGKATPLFADYHYRCSHRRRQNHDHNLHPLCTKFNFKLVIIVQISS